MLGSTGGSGPLGELPVEAALPRWRVLRQQRQVEFERVKDKSLEQQLQVVVYNLIACEAHMQQRDPQGTRKQQDTRAQRIGKVVDKLREARVAPRRLPRELAPTAPVSTSCCGTRRPLDAAKTDTEDILNRQLPDLAWAS